nr:histidine-type phosphatase [Schwartzia sp. (in: firmicutes)]
MKIVGKIGTAIVVWSLFFSVAVADYAEAEQTVKTVVVARHSIRAPLGGEELNELTPHKWPESSVPAGWLTPRGALAETLMGQYFRTMLTEEGLFAENYAPKDGEVRFYANSFQRTVATARYFAAGMLPLSDVHVEYHYGVNEADPVFLPSVAITDEAKKQKIAREIKKFGGIKHWGERYTASAKVVAGVLDFSKSAFAAEKKLTNFPVDDITLETEKGLRWRGTMRRAALAADAMVMDYYESGGNDTASFGHKLTRHEWHQIADLQNMGICLYYELPTLSREVARPLLTEVSRELAVAPRKFTFLCGHDSNIATVLTALGVEPYRLQQSLESVTPIGAMIVLKKIIGDDGLEYADISLVYQSTEQLIKLQTLDRTNPPITCRLHFQGLSRGENGLYRYADIVKRIADATRN